ncbi:hypothetical protein CORC01_01218, partial [Colletotrichum orchidophilum]
GCRFCYLDLGKPPCRRCHRERSSGAHSVGGTVSNQGPHLGTLLFVDFPLADYEKACSSRQAAPSLTCCLADPEANGLRPRRSPWATVTPRASPTADSTPKRPVRGGSSEIRALLSLTRGWKLWSWEEIEIFAAPLYPCSSLGVRRYACSFSSMAFRSARLHRVLSVSPSYK